MKDNGKTEQQKAGADYSYTARCSKLALGGAVWACLFTYGEKYGEKIGTGYSCTD